MQSSPDAGADVDPGQEVLGSAIDFPCGLSAQNRFAKASLYEALAAWGGGPPNDEIVGLYHLWAQGNWGIILTGNVQVSKEHLTIGRDMCVPPTLDEVSIAPFKRVAAAIHAGTSASRTLALMQLSHSGRQSPRLVGGRSPFAPPLGASSIPMVSRSNTWIGRQLFKLMFTPPREATEAEIEEVVESFVRGAELAVDAGFDGIQLHCSHGYLIAQFMSPKTNTRPPPYGPPSSLYLLRQLISRIRAAVPPTFLLAIKLNASDYVKGGLTEDDALEQVRVIAGLKYTLMPGGGGERTAVDLIEVSGGDYETPVMSKRPSARQAFFATFSRRALEAVAAVPNPPRIMLTGGFTSTSLMAETITAQHAEIVGVGRASIADPLLPRRFFDSHPRNLPIPIASTEVDTDKQSCHLAPIPDPSDLAPNPPAPWWTPPEILANASVGTAQWTALLHRRATFGERLLRVSPSSLDSSSKGEDQNESEHEDVKTLDRVLQWQHIGGIRSVVELLIRADTIDISVWLIKYILVLSMSVGVSVLLQYAK